MISNHTCSDRPLPTYKTSIVVTATIFTVFKADIQRWRPAAATKKEVARPSAAPLLFVVFFVEAVNIVNIVAVNTVLVLHLSQPGGLLAGRAVDRKYGESEGNASDWLF